VADGVGHGSRGAEIHTGEGEAVEAQTVYDCFEVPDSCVEGLVRRVPIGCAHSANVVPDDSPSERRQTIGDAMYVLPFEASVRCASPKMFDANTIGGPLPTVK
jgi:hypothetical protein